MAKKPVKPKLPETEEGWIKYCIETFENQHLTEMEKVPMPTWSLWPGMAVEIGHLVEPVIVETAYDGRLIVVRCRDKGLAYGQPYDNGFKYGAWPWTEVLPLDTVEPTSMMLRSWMHPFTTQHLWGALRTIQRWGYIDNPDYQRGYVWTEEDRTKLIDSIADGYPIGGLIFKRHPYPENRLEIIDGKQRVNCMLDFVEGRWPWRGKYWYQLSSRDRGCFEDRATPICELPEHATRAECLRMFLACNRGGVPQTSEHLEFVQKLYDEEVAKEKANGSQA